MYYKTRIDPYKDVPLYARVVSSSFYIRNRHIVEELFYRSIQANIGEYSLFELQKELLATLINVEQAREKCLHDKGLCRKGLKRLGQKGAPRERIKYVQDCLETIQDYIDAAEWIVRQLRSIGDSIAWRFLKYDRSALRLLAEHDYVQVPQVGRGLSTEIEAIQYLREKGYSFIWNAITNFLRVGDVTIFDEENDKYWLMEVKTSLRQTNKTRRQSEYRGFMQECLGSGLLDIKGVTITKQISDKPLLTYVKSVDSAITEANNELVSSRLFGDYLSVGVFALAKMLKECSETERENLQDEILRRCLSVVRKKDDITMPPMSNIFRMAHFIPNFAPYPIFPLDYDARLKLLTGDLFLISILNVSGLARWLIKRGWEVAIVDIHDSAPNHNEFEFRPFLKAFRNYGDYKKGAEIPLDAFSIAAVEFWMPESIENSLSKVIELDSEAIFHIINFPNYGKCAWD